jgi:hypothetical protein
MLQYCEKLRTMITLRPHFLYATILSFTARIVRATDSTPPLLQRGSIGLPNCARRARPFRGRALREHRAILGCLAAHFLSFIARSTSRLASRVLMDSRRSCCFLPLANPSSTLARPRLEK